MKGVVRHYQEVLAQLNLPDLSTLLNNTSSSNVWKTHTKKILAFRAGAYLYFLEECDAYHLSSCSLKALRPVPQLASDSW